MSLKKSLFPMCFNLAEHIVTLIVRGLPTSTGSTIRNVAYGPFYKKISRSAYIQPGARLSGVKNIAIGNNVRISKNSYIRSKGDPITFKDAVVVDHGVDIRSFNSEEGSIVIGDRTYIGPYVCIRGRNVSIGRNCLIAAHSSIIANNHNFDSPNKPIRDQGWNFQGIRIEEDCWIGSGVRVLDGVTIGRGSVIGAGAVVTHDIPPNSVAVGVPAKVLRPRTRAEKENSALSRAMSLN